jgi:hypothetical protein
VCAASAVLVRCLSLLLLLSIRRDPTPRARPVARSVPESSSRVRVIMRRITRGSYVQVPL